MNKKIARFMSAILCGAMLLSLAACRDTETPADGSSVSSDQSTELPLNSEPPLDSFGDGQYYGDGDLNWGNDFDTPSDGFFDGELEQGVGDPENPIDIGEITVERPLTAGLISSGIKLAYTVDEEIDLPGDEGIDEEFPIDEDIDLSEHDYTALIQKNGEKVKGSTRSITVHNSEEGIVFTDFSGLSANVFPTCSTLHAQTIVGDAEAFLESNGERFNDVALRYGRAWFQIDWIVTDEAGDHWVDYKDNPEDNPDYKNYMNGIYCFSEGQKHTDHFNSAIDYFKMMEEAGTEVYLAFGWKVGERVHDWFGVQPNKPDISAPRDLKAYAKAAAALFKYMRNEVGLTNFNTLSFYNEPDQSEDLNYQGSWDYVCLGDKCVYWAAMAMECQKEFDKHDDLKDVLIMGADCSNNMEFTQENYVNPYIRNNVPEAVDCYTFHYYGYSLNGQGNYDAFFDKCVFVYNYYEKPCYITEYYTTHIDLQGDADGYAWTDWSRSLASLYIASANTGIRGIFKWTAVVGLVPSGWGNGDGGNISWMRPLDVDSINTVTHAYYQEALLNNYVPNGANVHNVTWTGDDIRTSAFTTKDGKDFTLVVEANEKSPKRSLQVNLEKALGKDIYVFRYGFDQVTDGNAIVPPCEKVIKKVGREFSYDIDGKYGIHVFTTLKPLKQVALYEKGTDNLGTAFKVSKGDSVTVVPEFIDCDENETVKWEVKRYNGGIKAANKHRENYMKNDRYLDRGTLTQKGNEMTYTVSDNAESGDIIAIRCTIVDGDEDVMNDRYAVTTIIVE